jgi:predicted O-methyltransferase YrrM
MLAIPEFEILLSRRGANRPAVSIITTVYDRLDCLTRCIHSVQALNFKEYEHVIVADGPGHPILEKIEALVADNDCQGQRTAVVALKSRRGDWGITPSAVGLSLVSGRYVCFLSDDNGYLPTHFDRLFPILEGDPELGFAYSSCLYGGRRVLDAPAPQQGQIDLGQPLFRRSLFDRHLRGSLPFHEYGWDWRMIEHFLNEGVRWKHLNEATFIYGLGNYPELISLTPPIIRVEPAPNVETDRPAQVEFPFRSGQSGSLPRELAGYRDLHRGETMLVCGCSSSLSQIDSPERFTTIGVNDVGRLFNPDYLVVVNPPSQFSGDRFRYVESSRARAIFTQLDLGISHPNVVRIRLGRRGGADLSNVNSLPYTRNSPYIALCLALHMGAKRIGLIGVDFTDHHFFGATGRHSLAGELSSINKEYAALADTCRNMGVKVYNLSEASRVTAFPKMPPEEFVRTSLVPSRVAAPLNGCKVFFVNYRFLSCGEVFSDGLRNAAQELNVESESAYWDDASLPGKIERFAPDLLFVVHGRRYSQRWGASLHKMPSAVWLLDEPYEVDDTSRFSQMFASVFLNDPSTLSRHKNSRFLAVCYDPAVCHYLPGPRLHRVGFIGGSNPARELMLKTLAGKGLLSYTVGGPWRDPAVARLCLSKNIPAAETSDLYRQTQIVVNVFRTVHHYNRERIPAISMNPRIYEALGCGALVVSERRPEIEQLCPEMPIFDSFDEMVTVIEGLLSDPARLDSVRKACIRRLAGHTYAHRLFTAVAAALDKSTAVAWQASSAFIAAPPAKSNEAVVEILPGWATAAAARARNEDGVIVLRNDEAPEPGSETGLVGIDSHGDIRLSFSVLVEPGAVFVAKIHQKDRRDQNSNSYHLVINGRNSYVARHDKIFHSMSLHHGVWQSVNLAWRLGTLSVEFASDRNASCEVQDNALTAGHCFLGVKAGIAKVRDVALTVPKVHVQPSARHARLTFTSTPRRNLIYHVWPVRGSMWQWNIEQIKSRLDLFNGRRLIGIVYDARSELPSTVERCFAGHGCEFLVFPNQLCGEVVTFPKMLRTVASTNSNEATFYAHAKGVKHEPSVPEPVKRWTELSYRAALDDWPMVRDHLEQFALTGSFKMLGRFRSHRNLVDWHYSGTFFWLRHARVFSRDCFAVPPFYCGVEIWPGKHFGRDEAGCLLFDNPGQLAYSLQFWEAREAELARWEAERRSVEPPPDLSQPLAFEGFEWPRLEQHPEEFAWFLERLIAARPRNILTIGGMHGGVEWHIARRFRSLGMDIDITGVELAPVEELLRNIEDARTRFRQQIRIIEGDSTSEKTRVQLQPHYDAVFIDGDHSYRASRSDFEFALSLRPCLIALHDIVDSDWHAQMRCCVSRLWSELCGRYLCEELAVGAWGGIGIVRPAD